MNNKNDKLSDVLGTLHKLTSAIFSDAIQRKLILDNLTEAVFTVDTELNITSFNKAAETLTGISEKEALTRKCTDLFPLPPDNDFCIIGRVLLEKRPVNKLTRFLQIGERTIPVMVNASPLTDNSGAMVGGVQSFQEIQEIFQRQLVLDNAFDGVFTVDMEYKTTLLNKAAEQIVGVNQEAVLGKPFIDFFFPEDRKPEIQNTSLAKAIQSGEPVVEECFYLSTARGDILPLSIRFAPLIDARGSVVGGVATFRDVTDQILNQYILDSVTDGVFTVNHNFVITSFNKALEKITGYRADEVMGTHCSEIFCSEICGTERCPMATAIQSGLSPSMQTMEIQTRDGRSVPVSVIANVLTDNMGNIIGGVEMVRDLTEINELRRKLAREGTDQGILTRSPKMKRILSVLPEFARSDATILILGESGTGKELIAQTIHAQSHRSDNPFVAVNSGALPDTLLESELFGYKAGAFTDARKDKKGRFAAAEKGTLFLDEIGDISPAMQVKLLRVIQSKAYEPLGANTPVKTDVRIIAATNRNLEEMVQDGTFREDLYYRLNVVKIELPPLRERMEDIPLLVEHFIDKFNRQRNRNVGGISQEVLSILIHHDFPGNIRELENIIEYAFILCHEGLIMPQHLPEWLTAGKEEGETVDGPLTLKDMERKTITEALKRNEYRKMKTCRELGISKDTLRRKIEAYNIPMENSNDE
ncbi:MAG: sigma 54-interacting transcriptional regulator [Desulfobulbaceae bacterium]|jgi:PAS domain S-box-containing protein|nr:sigma 54-interacting transcriptional regulator [Desulfobulbaceae bacterium]